MNEDANEQTSLDEIVNEHSGADNIDEDTGDGEKPTVRSDRIETSIGILPVDWDVERLSEICEINPDGFSEDDWENETFEYISLSEVSKGEILRSETVPLDEAPSRAQREIKAGDVLVGTVRPKQVSHGLVTEEHDGKICSSGFGVLRTGSNLNGFYLLQEVLSHRFFRQMEAYVAGSGYPAVNVGDLKKHRIGVPPLAEQRKIASVLYNTDQAIQKVADIIEKTNEVKKGIMQDIMTEGVDDHEIEEGRLGLLPSSWKLKQISEIAEINPDSFSPDDHEENVFEYIDLSNVSEGTIIDTDIIKTEDAPSRARRKVREKDVLIGTVRPKQRSHAIVPSKHDGKVCSTGFGVIRANDQLYPEYLAQEIFCRRFFRQMEAYVAGSGYPAVNNSDLKKIRIAVPPMDEQKQIAEILSKYDDMIEKKKDYRNNLQHLKRGLMQDLLSGEVRTTDRDIDVLPEVEKHG